MTETTTPDAPAHQRPFSTVSVIIPVRPGGEVGRALEGLKGIDFPAESIEVIIAEGSSPARQRNEAAKRATGDLLFFLDNDSSPKADWLERAAAAMAAQPEAVGIGGPNVTPQEDSFWQHAYGCALASLFAHASMAARYRPIGKLRKGGEKELILCGMAVTRAAFEEAKGFDESLFPNEENEFMNRLTRGGKALLYHPDAQVSRSRRRNLLQFMGQMAKYGRGRMEQTFVEEFHPGNVFFLAPLVFSLYLGLVALTRHPLLAIPLMGYLAAAFISAAEFKRQLDKPGLDLYLPFVYVVMHLSYSVGLVQGLVKRLRHGNVPHNNAPVAVSIIKERGQPWNT